MDQFAVLYDIHANIWALEAVLADIAKRGPSQLINLGDTLYGPLEPQATATCLMGSLGGPRRRRRDIRRRYRRRCL